MSALSPKSNIDVGRKHVPFGPIANIRTVDEIHKLKNGPEPCRAIAPAWLRDGVPIAIPAGQPRAGRQSTARVRMYVASG
jgi:hypothetical protein